MQEQAYAKINLTLDITGQDERGYHLLSSLFARISLSDTVTLERGGKGISLKCNLPYVPTDGRNLCCKAANLLLDEFGLSERDFHIDLVKRIPVCAGLGGGSSDAAAVLKLLCAHFGIDPLSPRVRKVALGVGADVPFFLQGGLCLAEGVGEILTPLPSLTGYSIVVAKTRERASTPEVYRLYDALPDAQPQMTPKFLNALQRGENFLPFVSNHLARATATVCPSVERLKRDLKAAGALAAEMSGSGSAVYGLFSEETKAKKALKIIDAQWKKLCRFV